MIEKHLKWIFTLADREHVINQCFDLYQCLLDGLGLAENKLSNISPIADIF